MHSVSGEQIAALCSRTLSPFFTLYRDSHRDLYLTSDGCVYLALLVLPSAHTGRRVEIGISFDYARARFVVWTREFRPLQRSAGKLKKSSANGLALKVLN